MGSTSKYGRARIDPNAPEALGICDRCGGLYNLKNLHFQWDWCGTGMVNQQLRVCRGAGTRGCYDTPQPQLRAIILPPDPPPARGVRPEPYEVDEQNHYTLRALIGKPYMFVAASDMMVAKLTLDALLSAAIADTGEMTVILDKQTLIAAVLEAVSEMTVNFSGAVDLTALIDAVGEVVAELVRGADITAAVEAASDMAAALFKDVGITAAIDAADAVTAVLAIGIGMSAALDGASDVAATLTQVAFVPVTTLTFFGSATAASGATITAPASIIAGDIIIIADRALNNSGLPTLVVPTGFTSISALALTDTRQIVSYKIAAGTEGGTNITGMSGTNANKKAMYVLRPSSVPTKVIPLSVNGQITDSNPGAQTVTSSAGAVALAAFAVYGTDSNPITPRTFSPAPDGEITPATNFYLAYKIYNSSPANISVDMDDEGLGNALQSFYIQVGT